jgi:leukotriene-A4 hydrolase
LIIIITKESLSCEKIQSLNDVYKFGETFNSEILFTWIRLCIKSKWKPIIYLALKFVSNQGRMKFTRPVYRFIFIKKKN